MAPKTFKRPDRHRCFSIFAFQCPSMAFLVPPSGSAAADVSALWRSTVTLRLFLAPKMAQPPPMFQHLGVPMSLFTLSWLPKRLGRHRWFSTLVSQCPLLASFGLLRHVSGNGEHHLLILASFWLRLIAFGILLAALGILLAPCWHLSWRKRGRDLPRCAHRE